MKSSNLCVPLPRLAAAVRLVSTRRAVRFAIPLLLALMTREASGQQLKLPLLQKNDSTSITLGLKTMDRVFAIEWPTVSGTRELFRRTPFTSWVREWELSLQQRLDLERRAALTRGWTVAEDPANEPAIKLPIGEARVAAPDTANKATGILTGRLGEYADIGMSVQGRGELGGAWTTFTPCDPGLQLTCRPSLFPQLKPDMQFAIRVQGTISERVHVNVDYDQKREFDAANNINVFYKGFEDEVLQLVEVGDVSIRLPASRYLTQGIPAGNFGFKTSGQLGPLEFQTVFAQQRGDVTSREFKLGGLGAGQKLEQEASLVVDDADYVEGQFFFLVDPASIRTPHIDALGLRASDVDVAIRPAREGEIQVYRDERPALNNVQQQAQLGYFLAEGVAAPRRHSGLFRRLVKDEHYVIHSSGLWIMLRSPLRADEALAISYITERGDTIGTFNAERALPGSTPTLKLLRGPVSMHQPGLPTWDYELHQVYRLDSSNNVDVSTVQLKISLGELAGGRTFKDVDGAPVSLLRLFGLDEDAPVDQIDQSQIYQPGRDAFGGMGGVMQPARGGITGTFIIFPTLRPFQRPAPVPSARLFTDADVLRVLGNDANGVIYDHPDPVVREGSGRFRLNFTYRLNVEGAVESFNLGAFGIREGSERLFMGERQLVSGVDYTIDYDLGAVTLNDAAGLFAQNPGGQIRATWEQKPVFQIAPTSVFGLNARYGLGRRGELNFVTLYQSEKTIMSRPQLGLEPGSIMLGGMSGRLDLGGHILDRALARVPGLRIGAPSAFTVTGELALSVPNPNTRDEAYLDDFETTEEFFLPTSRRRWYLGSRPESVEGAASVLPVPLDQTTATRLVWQHDVLQDGRVGGSMLPRAQIDNQILIAGNELPESVLWLTLGDSTPNTVGRRWRSMTTVLSTTGRDLTRSEYIEFYVWSTAVRGQTLVLDVGTVSEDAFFFNESRATGGVINGKRWGLGVLDEEARATDREVWGKDKDLLGLWDQTCTANQEQQYALGDPNANCARNNGEPDSEDLDGNGVLDGTDQAYFRYVIPIDETSTYLVRDTSATRTNFRLFRVPLRTRALSVNGANDGTWRFIKHLRMTVSSTPALRENFVFARMRITGSRWTKRDVHGIVRGLVGDQPSASGSTEHLQVGPVSRLNEADYAPPLGVGDELQDPSQRFGGGAVEFNEKSLRVSYEQLAPGDRAEVYYRYPQQSRGLMSYRQLRLWGLARKGRWGPNGDMRLLIKVGNDPRNYYLYQTKLTPPATGAVSPSQWLPEIVIEFEQWFRLRERATDILERTARPPGESLAVWSEDSTYAVVLEDRARAPNLGALRELTFAVYNAGSGTAEGEVWIDDMRLTAAFKDPGMAGTISMDLRGGDFLSANITYADQSAVFRQLNQDARYQRSGDLSVATTAQLGQFLPGGWGVDAPLTVVHARSALDPTFLEGTDVRARGLSNLRDTGSDATRVALTLRKRTPSANPWLGLLIDGLQLRAGYNTADNSSITTRADARGIDGGLLYGRELTPRTVDILPGFMDAILRALSPAAVERSNFFQRLSGSRLRWSPERISFGTQYFEQERRSYQFNRILQLPEDSATRPIESPRHGLENDAQITFAPFQALRANFTLRSSRDLLDAERASTRTLERNAIERARGRLGGLDIGWESTRQMGTELSYRPEIAPWLRPNFNYSARYGTDRNPSYLEVQPDSTALMQRRFQADRQLTRGFQLEPGGLLGGVFNLPVQGGDSVLAARSVLTRWAFKTGRALQPVELNWNSTVGSQFERELHTPRVSYQFGLGGFDSFRLIGGDTAAFVNARDAFVARSGVRLPLNLTVGTSYEETTLDAIDQRGGQRTEMERRWPNAQVSWSNIPVPKFVSGVITSATLTLTHENARQRSLLGSIGAQNRGGKEQRNAATMNLVLPYRFTASYTAQLANGTSTDPTGDAENGSDRHTISLGGAFHPPESMREKLRAPVTVALTFDQQSQRQCRFRPALVGELDTGNPCVSFIDFRNRRLNLRFDTQVTDLTVGFDMTYNSRQSFVGTRNGTSQFQLGFFGNFLMKAGRDLEGSGPR